MNGFSEAIDLILKHMFSREDDRFDKIITNLNRENDILTGHPAIGFLLQGEYFKPKASPHSMDREMLHIDLLDQGFSFLTSKKQVDLERQLIKQCLVRMMKPCMTQQDVRDALPDCLMDFFDDPIRSLTRTRPVGFNLDDRAQRQYLEIKDTIEFYSISRLLY